MKEIYIVTQGEYSDYHIVAVFDNKKEAQKFVDFKDKYGGYYSLGIETFNIYSEFEKYLLKIDEDNDENNYMTFTYDSGNENIEHERTYKEKSLTIEVYDYYDKYSISIAVKATPKNILKAEKAIHDKVAEIEYKLQNEFNGDFEAFREAMNKDIEENEETIKMEGIPF